MMEDLPFYLKGTGDNLLTKDVLDQFIKDNPELNKLVKTHTLELRILDLEYFRALCYWILGQQISGQVAEIFISRFNELFEQITPYAVIETDREVLKQIGLSESKTTYIRALAAFFLEHRPREIHNLKSEDITQLFRTVRGIGPWTINMFLIFNLGRLDVGASNDLVVRKGLQRMYDLDNVPTVRSAEVIMSNWGQYKTVGTVLAWAIMGE